MRVRILDPRATKLLKDLAEMNLISLENISDNGFLKVLSHLEHKKNNSLLGEMGEEIH